MYTAKLVSAFEVSFLYFKLRKQLLNLLQKFSCSFWINILYVARRRRRIWRIDASLRDGVLRKELHKEG